MSATEVKEVAVVEELECVQQSLHGSLQLIASAEEIVSPKGLSGSSLIEELRAFSPFIKGFVPLTTAPLSSSFGTSSPSVVHPFDSPSPLSKQHYCRSKLIQELLTTEESFLSMLKILKVTYLEGLNLCSSVECLPLVMCDYYVSLLYDNHWSLLSGLQKLYRQPISKQNIMFAVDVAKWLAEKGICCYVYQQYYLAFGNVTTIVTDHNDYLEFTKTKELHLRENTLNHCIDLSFKSLLQAPIARIAKYKLFIESMVKTCPKGDITSQKLLKDSLDSITRQLESINSTSYLYEGPTLNWSLPENLLGSPILGGNLDIVWVTTSGPCHEKLAVFLYKSHLVMGTHKKESIEVKFCIPLSLCHISETDDIKGLYTTYDSSIKIAFEHEFQWFEFLILTTSVREYQVWKRYLHLAVVITNGGNNLKDFSASFFARESKLEYACKLPKAIAPCDLLLSEFDQSSNSAFAACYFFELQLIKIVQRCFTNADDQTNLFEHDSAGDYKLIVYIKRCETSIEQAQVSTHSSDQPPRWFKTHRFFPTDTTNEGCISRTASNRSQLLRKASMVVNGIFRTISRKNSI